MPFLEARGIVKRYAAGGRELTVLRDLDSQPSSNEVGLVFYDDAFVACDAYEHELGRFWTPSTSVRSSGTLDAVAEAVSSDLGPAGALITCAGLIANSETVMDMDMAAHDRVWAVNYKGTVHACQAFGRQMIANQRGAIVTIGAEV